MNSDFPDVSGIQSVVTLQVTQPIRRDLVNNGRLVLDDLQIEFQVTKIFDAAGDLQWRAGYELDGTRSSSSRLPSAPCHTWAVCSDRFITQIGDHVARLGTANRSQRADGVTIPDKPYGVNDDRRTRRNRRSRDGTSTERELHSVGISRTQYFMLAAYDAGLNDSSTQVHLSISALSPKTHT